MQEIDLKKLNLAIEYMRRMAEGNNRHQEFEYVCHKLSSYLDCFYKR